MSTNGEEYAGEEMMAPPWSDSQATLPKEFVRLGDIRQHMHDEFSALSASILKPGIWMDMPFRKTQLPPGWYVRDGYRYALESREGQALLGLSEEYRQDHGITVTEEGINVPNAFSDSGKGCFSRPVDGETRLPGSIEQDAARPVRVDVTGGFSGDTPGYFESMYPANPNGVFKSVGSVMRYGFQGGYTWQRIGLDLSGLRLSLSSAVAQENQGDENRPLNIGMTPCIYLGTESRRPPNEAGTRYMHMQSTAQTVWRLNHGLNDPFPDVLAVDENKVALAFQIDYANAGGNFIDISFSVPKTGIAIVRT